MLTYSMENTNGDSLYLYLYKCIRNDILSGKLLPGEKLPSKRIFAKELGVSVITIENAYSQLLAEGYIYSVNKKGFYVSMIPSKMSFQKKEETDTKISEPETYSYDLLHTSINPHDFPFSVWSKLMREVLSENSEKLLMRVPAAGILELREALAHHLNTFRRMNISASQIILGAGTEYFYSLLSSLLGRDRQIAVENPGYKKIADIYTSLGILCHPIDVDENGLSVKALEKTDASIVHISPSHHFPTGIIMPVSRRYELLSWASKAENRYIIEDDYDCEFRLSGKPIPALQSIDVLDKVIYINTFSKSLAPSFRISYMVLPVSLMKKFQKQLGFYACTVSSFEQYTLARFMSEGYFDRHINHMKTLYRTRKDFFLKTLNESPLAKIATVHNADSGLHLLLELSTNLSDNEILRRLRSQKIKISCLSEFYIKESTPKEHFLFISYSGLNEENIPEIMKILCTQICST